jgi:hypothetical protein
VQRYFHVASLVNAVVAFAVLYAAARPTLQRLGVRRHLMGLTALHLFRYIGLTLALPGHFDWTALAIPDRLAFQLAWWDFLNGILALVAFVALWRRSAAAIPLTGLFVAVAMGDQLISGGELFPYLVDARAIGPMPWLLLAAYLPLLIVSSVAIIVVLSSRASRDALRADRRPAISASASGAPRS